MVYVGHPPAHIGWVRFYGQMDGLAALESNPYALKSNTRIGGLFGVEVLLNFCASLVQTALLLPNPRRSVSSSGREFRGRK